MPINGGGIPLPAPPIGCPILPPGPGAPFEGPAGAEGGPPIRGAGASGRRPFKGCGPGCDPEGIRLAPNVRAPGAGEAAEAMSLATTGEDDVDAVSSCSGVGERAISSAPMPFSSVSVVGCCASMMAAMSYDDVLAPSMLAD